MQKIVFFLLLISFVSCNNSKTEVVQNAIANVDGEVLYDTEINGLVPPGTTKKDSLVIVQDFIDRWASKKLLFNAAQQNLSKEKQEELDKLIAQYKNDLYTNAYMEQLVFKNFDSIITESELKSYYEKYKNQFKTNQTLVRLRFVQINNKNPKLSKLSNHFIAFNKKDKEMLQANAIEFKSYAFNDSVWVDMNQVYEKLPFINVENYQNYLQIGQTFKKTDSLDVFLIKTVGLIPKNEISPYQYVKPTLTKVIRNNRKLELIKKFQKEITTDAIKDKKYEIYK